MKVEITVNGDPVVADVEDRMLLVHFVRDVAGLTATNVGSTRPRAARARCCSMVSR